MSVSTISLYERSAPALFWKVHGGPYSNLASWSSHTIVDCGLQYRCVEQFVQYRKAVFHGDLAAAADILNCKTAKEARARGKRIHGFNGGDAWKEKAFSVYLEACTLKFRQHPDVRETLVATRGREIGEASPTDHVVGIALAWDDPRAKDSNHWPGQNIHGGAWMHLRDTVLD